MSAFNVEKGKDQGEQREFAQPKKGQRAARLLGLVDVGVQPGAVWKGEQKNPTRQFVPFYWLAKDTYENDEGDTKHMVRSPWPISIFAGATRGHYFDFCQGFDPEGEVLNEGSGDLTQLLGSPVLVSIEVTKKTVDGKEVKYYNPKGLSGVPEDYPVAELDVPTFVFDTDAPTKEGFDKLNNRCQELIKGSIGYAGSKLQAACEGDVGEPQEQKQGSLDDFDDDIPF